MADEKRAVDLIGCSIRSGQFGLSAWFYPLAGVLPRLDQFPRRRKPYAPTFQGRNPGKIRRPSLHKSENGKFYRQTLSPYRRLDNGDYPDVNTKRKESENER